LAYLIVLLPLLLLQEESPSAAMGKWLLDALIVGVVLAVVLGGDIGYLAARALHHADDIGWMERNSLLGLSVSLSLAVVAFAKVLGSDGILAAFAAGTAFNLGIERSEEFEEQRVQETIGELFNPSVSVIFGAMLPWAAWASDRAPSHPEKVFRNPVLLRMRERLSVNGVAGHQIRLIRAIMIFQPPSIIDAQYLCYDLGKDDMSTLLMRGGPAAPNGKNLSCPLPARHAPRVVALLLHDNLHCSTVFTNHPFAWMSPSCARRDSASRKPLLGRVGIRRSDSDKTCRCTL
jgi:hypothetical protein